MSSFTNIIFPLLRFNLFGLLSAEEGLKEVASTQAYGAFPLHGTVRYGTAQFGSVCISTAV